MRKQPPTKLLRIQSIALPGSLRVAPAACAANAPTAGAKHAPAINATEYTQDTARPAAPRGVLPPAGDQCTALAMLAMINLNKWGRPLAALVRPG